jgi:hypothetical protein
MTDRKLMDIQPCRMWINQPSTLQPYHKYHGRRVLTVPPVIESIKGSQFDFITVYFTEGVEVSMEVFLLALSKGWNSHQ